MSRNSPGSMRNDPCRISASAESRRGKAHAAFPGEPLRGRTVRSRHIGERAGIRRDIGQEQPRLDGRVKRVGVQQGLRIGRAVAGVPRQALDPDHRLGVAAADIADQPAPFRRAQDAGERRQRSQGARIERDLAHDRVALGDLAQRAAIRPDLIAQLGEFLRRQKIAPDDKPVAREIGAVRGRNEVFQAAAAPLRRPRARAARALHAARCRLSRRLPITALRSNDFVPVSSCAVHHGTSAARPIRVSIPRPCPKLPVSCRRE